MNQSVFFDEWRRCLQEHYKAVVRRNDHVAEKTLMGVLSRVGFREDELRMLYMEATMHVDRVPNGFMPNAERLKEMVETAQPLPTAVNVLEDERTFLSHPNECSCPSCMEKVDTTRHDDEGQPLDAEAIQENLERQHYEAPEEAVRSTHIQRSLF